MNDIEKAVFIFVLSLCAMAGCFHAFDVYIQHRTEVKYLECIQATRKTDLCSVPSMKNDRGV